MKSPKNKTKKKKPTRVAQGIEEMGGLLTEQCRLYRAARRGEVTPTNGFKLMKMLAEIRTSISTHDIEDRLAALEQVAKNR